jgi:hypothetical protein
MERIEPTRAIALKVWWAFIWRAVVFALLSGFAVGLGVGLLAAALKLTPEQISPIAGFFGLVIGAGVSIEVMFRLLRKKFQGFEIAIVKMAE